MSSKRVRIILLTGIALIVLIIGISLILTYASRQTINTDLPQTATAEPSGAGATASGSPAATGLSSVSVTEDNVQAVIATMARRGSYTRSVKVENFNAEGKAVSNIDVAVLDGATAMKINGSGSAKYIVLAGGRLYVWYDGDKEYYSGPADALGQAQSVADQFQMIATYEDILKLDKSSIQDASFTTYGGENCIYVEYVTELPGYATIWKCYISVQTGLLADAEQYEGETLVYRMTTSAYDPAEPDASAFNLPDGKNAFSAP
ncbi:hypothetical protein SAMN02745823_01450 [Sporobacter termitidis DSM 10068]|uniref:Uncharacterized protein n=1 Tax=Sporobacter termitidis DSM 10068 TaxID=1123282 RepID=A0A1M5WYC5_9FIRM|nr:hypothetical protein [Sporobacter termitidis]SHH92308.1 hypothetical protein SAMN02745823_01450 [Sporobacter termitidis DSM 10068]